MVSVLAWIEIILGAMLTTAAVWLAWFYKPGKLIAARWHASMDRQINAVIRSEERNAEIAKIAGEAAAQPVEELRRALFEPNGGRSLADIATKLTVIESTCESLNVRAARLERQVDNILIPRQQKLVEKIDKGDA